MQVTNPILILGFIPIFKYGVYPLFGKLKESDLFFLSNDDDWIFLTDKLKILRTPLQRIVAGCILASISFYISGGLEMILEVIHSSFRL